MAMKFLKINPLLEKYLPNVFVLYFLILMMWSWAEGDYFFAFLNKPGLDIWSCLVLFSLLGVNKRYWHWVILGLAGVGYLLYAINVEKILILKLPLTILDIKIFLKNPQGLFNALGFDSSIYIASITLLTILMSYFLYILITSRLKTTVIYLLRGFFQLSLFFICMALFTIPFNIYGKHLTALYVSRPFNIFFTSKDQSPKMDILSQLAYLNSIFSLSQNQKSKNNKNSQMIPDKNIDEINSQYMVPMRKLSSLKPNIVFILAESTFDPNKVFHLNRADTSVLFQAKNNAQRVNLLNVTPIGGGTDISEFETNTGIDTRYFPFFGYYVSQFLAPNLKFSFAKYLGQKGYSSEAFCPTDGAFVNSRASYEAFGFQNFLDVNQLNLTKYWSIFSDEKMIDAVLPYMDKAKPPFFDYIVFLENHSPHRCVHFADHTQYKNSFKAHAIDADNCSLNEYLRREAGTTRAYNKVLKHLQDISRQTNRPFVLVIFGDHQPSTFVLPQYDQYRTELSKKYTFTKIVSNLPFPLQLGDKASFHATLLPTIVSAYLTNSPSDLYMPENLYLWSQCNDTADLTKCAIFNSMGVVYQKYLTNAGLVYTQHT
ncbi:MAG: sulfatase-like hydrolase/transferase [Legionellales bacterium]|nr:sulfatase-like hydrolase/transferase [Legionellales bacterium]